jgi:hypothetical protein
MTGQLGAARARFDEPLQRTLRGLPDPLLAALVSGLERYGEELAPRRLFTGDGRSCAVGAMLRELRPGEFDGGGLRFWWRHGRRQSAVSYGGPFASPRIRHLEHIFDASVALMPDPADPVHAHTVGRWVLALAQAELGRRHDGGGAQRGRGGQGGVSMASVVKPAEVEDIQRSRSCVAIRQGK